MSTTLELLNSLSSAFDQVAAQAATNAKNMQIILQKIIGQLTPAIPAYTPDVTPPTVPTGVVGVPASTSNALSWDSGSDVAVPGASTSGRAQYNVTRVGAGVVGTVLCTPGQSFQLAGQDIGSTGIAGSSVQSGADWTLQGAGLQIYGISDSYQFACVPMTGNGSIIAELHSFPSGPASFSEAGLMFRETTAAGSSYVHLCKFPDSGGNAVKVEYRNGAGTSALNGASVATVPAPVWLKLERAGNLFTASYGTDSNNWTVVDSKTVPMASTIFVGLSACSLVPGTLVTAAFRNVNIQLTDTKPTFTDTGLTANTAYQYTITSQDAQGNVSAASAPITVTTSSAAAGADKAPLLAAIAVNGSGSFYSAAAKAQFAGRHISLHSFYRGWNGNNSSHPTEQTIVANAKAASTLTNPPIMIPHIIWTDISKTPGSSTAAAGDGPWYNYCINNGWLLYTNGLTNTGPVNSGYSASYYHANTTNYSVTVAGKRSWEYFIDYVYGYRVAGSDPTSGDPAFPINRATGNDGIFCDAVWTYLDKSGDYNRDGTSDPAHVTHVDQPQDQWARDGQKSLLTYARTKFGANAIIIGNLINGDNVYYTPSLSGLENLMDGVLLESLVGLPGSSDSYRGTSLILSGALRAAPYGIKGYNIFHQDGFTSKTSGLDALAQLRGDPAWQCARYGMACAAMIAFYYANTINQNYNIDSAFDIDEFDNAGRFRREWLGNRAAGPRGAIQSAAWLNGIWRCDYDNGIVLMRPRVATTYVATVDTTPITVALGGTYYRLHGNQDPSTNSGAAITSWTSNRDRDGLFLSNVPT